MSYYSTGLKSRSASCELLDTDQGLQDDVRAASVDGLDSQSRSSADILAEPGSKVSKR